jgi:hypothetical protein
MSSPDLIRWSRLIAGEGRTQIGAGRKLLNAQWHTIQVRDDQPGGPVGECGKRVIGRAAGHGARVRNAVGCSPCGVQGASSNDETWRPAVRLSGANPEVARSKGLIGREFQS